MDASVTAPPSGSRPIDRMLQALFAWSTGMPRAEAAELGGAVLDTVMLRPLPLVLSSAGILLMSGSAAAMTGQRWAQLWFVADLVFLILRLIPAWRTMRGRALPDTEARIIVCVAFGVFVMFGLGCTACMIAGPPALRIAATTAMMGLVAGLATRWAALPRLAMVAITLCTVPFCLAIAATGMGGALQFAVVAGGTATLTLQNRRTLIAMLRAEHRARRLAETDALTGLPNRVGLFAEWRRLEREAPRTRDAVTILYLDLDGFKAVNDQHGHDAGDRLLVQVAQRLRDAAAPHFVCRLGGDEFVVVAAGVDEPSAAAVSAQLHAAIDRPVLLDGAQVRVGASIGSASAGMAHVLAGAGADQLLRDADAALYRIKRGGRAGVPVGLAA